MDDGAVPNCTQHRHEVRFQHQRRFRSLPELHRRPQRRRSLSRHQRRARRGALRHGVDGQLEDILLIDREVSSCNAMSLRDRFCVSSKRLAMYQDDSGLEQRLSRFEAQLDRFSLALRQWQETQSQSPAAGPPDLDQRIRALEETITREALALRQIHEEPLKQLQGQAESLGDLSRSLQSLVTDLRIGTGASTSQGSAASWPLERVVNLHDELRRGANSGGSQGVHSETPLPEAAGPPSRRVRLLQPPNDLETAPPHAIESRTLRTPGRYTARVAPSPRDS